MKKYHAVSNISIDGRELSLRIDGVDHAFPLRAVSDKLPHATQSQRARFEVSPSGYGIHWPVLDEDLSVDGLLKTRKRPSRDARSAHSTVSSSR